MTERDLACAERRTLRLASVVIPAAALAAPLVARPHGGIELALLVHLVVFGIAAAAFALGGLMLCVGPKPAHGVTRRLLGASAACLLVLPGSYLLFGFLAVAAGRTIRLWLASVAALAALVGAPLSAWPGRRTG